VWTIFRSSWWNSASGNAWERKERFKLLAVYLAMKLKVAKKLSKEIHREYSLLALLL
jgi:hypothetical protein